MLWRDESLESGLNDSSALERSALLTFPGFLTMLPLNLQC